MLSILPQLLLPIAVGLIIIFLSIRLQLFVEREIPGRFAFISGGILIFIVAVWHAVEQTGAYQNWFLTGVYEYLDFAQFIVLMIGLISAVIGLAFYADYWQIRKEEIDIREHKLSILDNLQRDARGPYQLMELLNISIKEITTHLPDCSGAVFLLNRARRQFVLTSSVGLTKDENALLEYYPLERNIISQSIDLGDPLISGQFTFFDQNREQQPSRFNSCLVLPMVSGRDKIGGIILLAEESQYFSRQEISYLQPIAEWLSEKIKAARLERELTSAQNSIKEIESNHSNLITRVMSASDSFMVRDIIESFCRSLVGMVSCKSAHLMGMSNGTLQYFGNSEPLFDLSESYKTALVDAIDRRKPLIINQEGKTEEGRTFVTLSTLVYPLPGKISTDAIVLRRESNPFKINDNDLKIVDLFAHLAQVVIQKDSYQKMDLTRRRGFDTILNLLRLDKSEKFDSNPEIFLEQIVPALPKDAQAVLFVKEQNGSLKARAGHKINEDILSDFIIYPGEGIVGLSVNNVQSSFVFGRNSIGKTLEKMDPPTREKFYQLFGEKGLPSFWAVCPVNKLDSNLGVAIIFFDITEEERGEWERVLTLASSLYSVRLTINELTRQRTEEKTKSIETNLSGDVINKLNNYLSAVIGNAELAFTRPELTGDVAEHLRSVIAEAEKAASFLKDSISKTDEQELHAKVIEPNVSNPKEIINTILDRLYISENLYMVGGRPREFVIDLETDDQINFADEKIAALAEETIKILTSEATDDEKIKLKLYRQDDFVYFDVYRIQNEYQPVELVSSYGNYMNPGEIIKIRPADTFLKHISDSNCKYAYDNTQEQSTYLSFKFPVYNRSNSIQALAQSKIKVLAIDDQKMILDLISAMCQSLGYEVQTASSGAEGIELVKESKFDIVLTDLAMPGISGLETATEIMKIRPGTPVVLVTGWKIDIDKTKLETAGIKNILYKPFRIENLTEVVQSLTIS